MSKTQSPDSKKPLQSETPLLTIHIHKTTALALLVGIVLGGLGVLALRTKSENPSAAGPQNYDGQQIAQADTSSAWQNDSRQQPEPADSSQSNFAAPVKSEEDYGAEPTPYHPGTDGGGNTDAAETSPVADSREQAPVVYVLPPQTNPPQADSAAEPPAQPETNDKDHRPAPTPRATSSPTPSPNPGPITLNGSGGPFATPLYLRWFSEFHRQHSAVQINYQAIGSGGFAQLQAGTVDFGASDTPLTDAQLLQTRTKVLEIPTVLNAVVPVYNLPGVEGEVKFTPEVLAGIFLGDITLWSDPAIARDNPGLPLPHLQIFAVHRADSAAATFVFTDFLSNASQRWRRTIGTGAAVNWPAGLAGKGDDGVAVQVQQTLGAIGYVEFAYARNNRMATGSVRNLAGHFVRAAPGSVGAAAASIKDIPPDFRVSLTNAPGTDAYPISSFTWLLVPRQFADRGKSRSLVDFLQWMTKDGQTSAGDLSYVPLPPNVLAKVRTTISEMH